MFNARNIIDMLQQAQPQMQSQGLLQKPVPDMQGQNPLANGMQPTAQGHTGAMAIPALLAALRNPAQAQMPQQGGPGNWFKPAQGVSAQQMPAQAQPMTSNRFGFGRFGR